MADYSQNIANLEAALQTGEKLVEIDGMRVMYQTPKDIIDAINYFNLKQAGTTAGAPGSQTTLAAFGAA